MAGGIIQNKEKKSNDLYLTFGLKNHNINGKYLMERFTSSEEQTKKIGLDLANRLQGGDILCLSGELGAGKTTLVKGLAAGLGIKKEITSPTFTLLNIYEVKKDGIRKLVHIDTYRLKNEEELLDIGAEDYLGAADTVCVIEWPEKIEELLKNKRTLNLKMGHEKNGRKITLE